MYYTLKFGFVQVHAVTNFEYSHICINTNTLPCPVYVFSLLYDSCLSLFKSVRVKYVDALNFYSSYHWLNNITWKIDSWPHCEILHLGLFSKLIQRMFNILMSNVHQKSGLTHSVQISTRSWYYYRYSNYVIKLWIVCPILYHSIRKQIM